MGGEAPVEREEDQVMKYIMDNGHFDEIRKKVMEALRQDVGQMTVVSNSEARSHRSTLRALSWTSCRRA